MSKFTPGPWTATERRVTAPETDDRLALDVQINGGNRDDNKANARLISAAPDLLAALQDAIEYLQWHLPEEALTTHRAAIFKATGKI